MQGGGMRSKGFTLIELMIVVAIIAILAAIAMQQYQNYVIRSQATRVMGEAGALIPAVEICINEGRLLIGDQAGECDPGATGSNLMGGGGNAAPGVTLPAATGVPLISAPLTATPTITAAFGSHAHSQLAGATIVWSRTMGGSWICRSTVGPKWAPVGCPN